MIYKTIILPGYSPHNKDWAQDIADKLNAEKIPALVHHWRHWVKGSFSVINEINKLLEEIGKDKINIIAKSVGVAVTLELIPKLYSQINKVILCGIASVSGEREKVAGEVFSKIPIENILCIQNERDKFVVFEDAKNFYHSINPNINVISKPRSDHEYPYFDDFKKFLIN